jgi:hypothetical protein
VRKHHGYVYRRSPPGFTIATTSLLPNRDGLRHYLAGTESYGALDIIGRCAPPLWRFGIARRSRYRSAGSRSMGGGVGVCASLPPVRLTAMMRLFSCLRFIDGKSSAKHWLLPGTAA